MTTAEKLVQIAENEQKIYDKGFEDGKAQGGGGDNHYDTFWDSCQRNGNRINYNYAFMGVTWNDTTYNPKYSFENVTSAVQMYQSNEVTEIGELYMPLLTTLNNTFAYSTKLVTIKKIAVSDNATYNATAFANCSALENVRFGSVISNNISFAHSHKLTVESLLNIIEHLADKSGDTSAEWILTIGGTNKAKLTNDELAVAINKGWQVN